MLVFSSVTKSFGDDTTALHNVSFQIDPGELVVITGPSGSGKTTLMKLLTKEYSLDGGSIQLDDLDLSQVRSKDIPYVRRRVGVVFQDYKLLGELTAWENIALALSIINTSSSELEQRVADLLDLVGLADKAFLFPHQLSGGEAQRISIARALSTAPNILFADEPTGNLDANTTKEIIELFKKINDLGTTVIVTTHDPLVMEGLGTDRLIEITRGSITKDTKASTSKPDSEPAEEVQEEEVEVKHVDEILTDTPEQPEPQSSTTSSTTSSKPAPLAQLGATIGSWFGKKATAQESSQTSSSIEESKEEKPNEQELESDTQDSQPAPVAASTESLDDDSDDTSQDESQPEERESEDDAQNDITDDDTKNDDDKPTTPSKPTQAVKVEIKSIDQLDGADQEEVKKPKKSKSTSKKTSSKKSSKSDDTSTSDSKKDAP